MNETDEQKTPEPTKAPITGTTAQPELIKDPAKQQTQAGTKKSLKTYVPQISRKAQLSAVGLLAVALIGFGSGYAGSYVQSKNDTTTAAERRVVLNSEGDVIADIAKEVGKSVVSINVTQQVTTTNFFGRTATSEAQAAGTGIIISTNGLIMTNRHVVPQGTSSVGIVLSDGTKFDNVEVIGRTNDNDSLDIAFLKVKDLGSTKLTAATLGDSSKMKVGDKVIAIGNALGQFQNTVTSGILSGYGRSVTAGDESGSESENLENLFQTDAAINQGNSGGPLVNMSGEVIGVNVATATDAQNLGFSIPVNDVKGLIESIESTGKLERPYMGVMYVPITSDIAKDYGLNTTSGAYVAPRAITGQDPVVSGSPADKAGLRAGDIITKINNDAINETNSLTAILGKHKVGDKITLTVVRDGKTTTMDLTLVAAPQS